jgi:uncharacterized membrane protein
MTGNEGSQLFISTNQRQRKPIRYEYNFAFNRGQRTGQLVYYQWIQFEEFPYFMEAVEEVRQESETRLFWRTRIGGIEKTWEAEITAQVQGEKMAWKSVDGPRIKVKLRLKNLLPIAPK